MAVDRGGLVYPIDVSYTGSNEVAAFRADTDKARQGWQDFKASLQNTRIAPINVPVTIGSAGGALGDLNGQTKELTSSIDGLANSFQRLFTRLVIVAAIREAAREFGNFVGEMVNFNAAIEKSTLGISSLLLALGDIHDTAGNGTNAVEGFALAQQEAAKQTAQLRVDALATASTFEELTKVFQTTIAPGLQAGLNLDQIREFSVGITQAATAINIPISELGAQIRAILGGTINQRNTTIARALGITNEDLKLAKETGDVFGYLQGKLSAFSTSGEASLNTFNVIVTNLKDSFAQVIGTGGLQFFGQLKLVFQEIQKSLVSINTQTGLLEPNPQAVTAVKAIADAFVHVIDLGKQIANEFVFGDLISGAKLLGATLTTAFDIAAGAIQGFIRGVKDVGNILLILKNGIEIITGFQIDTSSVQKIVALITEVSILVTGIVATLTGLATVITTINAPLLGLLAIMVALGVDARYFASQFIGLDIKFSTLALIIKDSFVDTFDQIKLLGTGAFDALVDFAKLSFNSLALVISVVFNGIIQTTLLALSAGLQFIASQNIPGFGQGSFVDKAAQQAKAYYDGVVSADDKATQAKIRNIAAEIAARGAATLKFLADAKALDDAQYAKSRQRIKENDTNPDIQSLIANALKATRDALAGAAATSGSFFGPAGGDLKKLTDDAGTFSHAFDHLPGIISPTLQSFKDQVKIMHDLNEAARLANQSLTEGLSVLGLQGPVLEERKNQFAAANLISKDEKQLLVDQKNLQEEVNGIIAQRKQVQDDINKLSQSNRALVYGNLINERDFLNLKQLESQAIATNGRLLKELAVANQGSDTQAVQAVLAKKEANDEYLQTLQDELQHVKDTADATLRSSGLAIDQRQKIIDLVTKKINLAGQEKVNEEELKRIANDKLDIELAANRAAADKNTLLAKEQSLQLANSNVIDRIKAANDAAEFNTRFSLPEVSSLVQARGALDLLQAQVAQAQKLRQTAIDQLGVYIQQNQALLTQAQLALALETNAARRVELGRAIASLQQNIAASTEQLGLLQDQNNAKFAEEAVQLQKASVAVQHARDVIQRPLQTGFVDGIRKAVQELPSLYQGVVNTIKSIVTGLTDFISTSIVDAFDPTKKEDIAARFAQFLQGIAKQVLDMFIQLAIAKLALGLGFLGDGGIAGGGLPGLGSFGGSTAASSGGGAGPLGSLSGIESSFGLIARPTGTSGTTGGKVSDAVNAFQRVLTNGPGVGGINRTSPISGAGNFISETSRARAASTGASGGNNSNNNQPQIHQAVVVASDASLDKLLSGGKNALFNFLQSNKSKVRGILGS